MLCHQMKMLNPIAGTEIAIKVLLQLFGTKSNMKEKNRKSTQRSFYDKGNTIHFLDESAHFSYSEIINYQRQWMKNNVIQPFKKIK